MVGVSQKRQTSHLFPPKIFTKAHSTLAPSVGGPMYICYMPFLFISVNSFDAFGPTWFLLLGGFYPKTKGN
jgi:hypothetical protein